MPGPDPREEAVLVLAPTGRDARLIAVELARHGFGPVVCGTLDQLCGGIDAGAGVALMAEEALPPAGLTGLVAALGRQPPWSDLPLLILTGRGVPSSGSVRRFEALEPVANVTQLERPVRTRTLVSAVRSALRARRRQYEVRDHLAERERAEAELRESEGRHRFLSELTAATQPLTDPDEVMGTSARLLAEHLQVDRCAYAQVEDESVYVITGDHARGVPSIVGRWPVAAFGDEHLRMMRAGEPYVVADADADPRVAAEHLAAYRSTNARAVVCVPLLKDGRLTAAIAVHQTTPRRWTAEEVELVTTVVGRCWEALERARVERDLRASEARYRTLFTSIDEGFCVIEVLFDPADPARAVDYRFLEVNPAFEAQSGMRAVVGRRMREFVADIEEHWLANYGRVALTGEPVRFANEYTGLNRWFEVYAFRVGPPAARRVAVLFTDITARRRAVEDRERLVEQLRDADRRKDEFLALLAHELRNPLAPLRNGLQVLHLAGHDSAAAEKARGMMDRQLTHMVRLIDDLLDVSRITRNKLALRRARVPLADVIASAVETVRPAVDAAGHRLSVSVPDQPAYLDADLTRLAQVFGNLLSNSVKYTPPGGRIWLSAEARDGQAVVTVRDTGIGIPDASLPHIFDMFSQVDRSVERSTGGLGIGLALVKGLVEMHGGTVTAASGDPGHGSVFTVRLPVMETPPTLSRATADGAAAPTTGRRILVVDDNRDGAESLAMMLRLMGNEVSLAHDGVEAVEAAGRVRPEVILMDVGMPRLNGLDAARQIREQPWGRAVTIVALTGWGQENDRERSRAAGCDGHLVKPVAVEDLSRLLAALRA
jgi:PAS domain S-box-containing protein